MQLVAAKILAIACLGLGTIFVGLLPACIMKNGRNQAPLVLSSLLCFGGGVLFSTSLVHILPEAKKAMPAYQQYAEIIFCGGFFLIYILDEIVHLIHGGDHNAIQEVSRDLSNSRRHSYGATERGPLINKPPPYNPAILQPARSDGELCDTHPPSQLCHLGDKQPCSYGLIINAGLLAALSTHALLEGLVVGLASDSAQVLLLLGAIASHKLVVGFCLGAEISTHSRNLLKNFISIFIFAMGSIVGILIGMIISNLPKEATELVIPILQNVAGGTLLYVTVSEILPRERAIWHQEHNRKTAGIKQFIAFTIGFVFLTILGLHLDED